MWRKDHHSYVLRKGSQTAVREDQTKLKHDGEEFAICAYTCGAGITKSQDSLPFSDGPVQDVTPQSFKRRAYWLKHDPKYVLVHYLDESLKYY